MDAPHPDDLDLILTALHDEYLCQKDQQTLTELFKGKLEPFLGAPLTPERAVDVGRVLRQGLNEYAARHHQTIVTDVTCDPETHTINVSLAAPLNEIDLHLLF
jgi:hypothetical protein